MDDTLDAEATTAEQVVADALTNVHDLTCLGADDFPDRLEQVRKRDAELADGLSIFQTSAVKRRANAVARLRGEESVAVPPMIVPIEDVKAFALKLKAEKDGLAQAGNSEDRAKLAAEKAELEDGKTLAANKSKLVTRRDLLVIDDAYTKALADVQTRGITQRANELLDTHLTTAVVTRFDAERSRFDIMHLNVESRPQERSDQGGIRDRSQDEADQGDVGDPERGRTASFGPRRILDRGCPNRRLWADRDR
ncbi:hypothetical protein ACFSKM_01740 [Ancylobacter dichloromethanicus]